MIQIKIFTLDDKTPDVVINAFLDTVNVLENGIRMTSDGAKLLVFYIPKREDQDARDGRSGASRAELHKELNELLKGAQIGRITAEANLRGALIRQEQKRGGEKKQEEINAFVLTCKQDIEEKEQQITMFKGMIQELEEGKFDVALAGMATQKGSGKRDGEPTKKD